LGLIQTELLYRKTLDADVQAKDILVTFVFNAVRTRIKRLQADLELEQDIFEQRYVMEKLDEWFLFESTLTELVIDLAKTTVCEMKKDLEQQSDDRL
jgi:hypothetical protein